ncbi:MAG: epoxyqueuosine reductase QueH [Lachnospiraceae bacterium]|nr:epoxyqueuosine reductase QueH [Lachnospiraceae bacterium]
MQEIIKKEKESGHVPALLLHSCCGPCSSAVLERLTTDFELTVFYYNPNIYPEEEYHKRVEEQERLINAFPAVYPIRFIAGEYIPADFYKTVNGLEKEPEGGSRCLECFRLRLREAAEKAQELHMDYFTTTLTVSPLKNAEVLNALGEEIARDYEGLSFLPSDFKKRNGYKRSCELSAEYDMYRQDYCGCVFSMRERHPDAE